MEKLLLEQFFLSGHLLFIAQIWNLCSNSNNLIYSDASSGIFVVKFIVWFYLENFWKIKILPHLHRYWRCLSGFQKLKGLYNSDIIGKCMRSVWFKMSNCKTPNLKFCRFFRQSVSKMMEKTDIWAILCVYLLSPLYNVEWEKLASINVMDTQHCIGGEGRF